MVVRKSFIVYFQNKKVSKEIEKMGVNITYINPKANYLVGYIDSAQYEKTKKQIQHLKLVKKVDESLLEMDHLEFTE